MVDHCAFAWHVHAYVDDYVALADKKAGFVFAAAAAMLAYVHSLNVTHLWLRDPRRWELPHFLAFCAVVGLIGAALAAVLTVIPRLGGYIRGIIYWKAISGFRNPQEYANHVASLEPAALAKATLEHVQELATISNRKYKNLNLGIWFGFVGFAASLLYIIFAK